MGYVERNAWSSLIASAIGIAIYAGLVIADAATTPIESIEWFWPMLWTIAGSIVLAVLGSIVLGIVAGERERSAQAADVRDREIGRLGDRVGQAFLVIAGVVALALCAGRVDWFWIANTVYAGFALSAVVGGVARVIVYRRGMP